MEQETQTIKIECLRCGNKMEVPKEKHDPKAAVLAKFNYCIRCDRGGEFEEVTYYNEQGEEMCA